MPIEALSRKNLSFSGKLWLPIAHDSILLVLFYNSNIKITDSKAKTLLVCRHTNWVQWRFMSIDFPPLTVKGASFAPFAYSFQHSWSIHWSVFVCLFVFPFGGDTSPFFIHELNEIWNTCSFLSMWVTVLPFLMKIILYSILYSAVLVGSFAQRTSSFYFLLLMGFTYICRKVLLPYTGFLVDTVRAFPAVPCLGKPGQSG